MKENPFISVISPVYGAEGIIGELVNQLTKSLFLITDTFEIILVEDNSPDNSWQEIAQEANTKKYIKGIRLSRNYGQHNAIAAGMELAKGDFIVLLDCDLQHNPTYIPELYKLIKNGNDLVFTRFQTRKHSFVRNITAKLYYKFVKFISGYEMDPNIGSYSMLNRKVVNAFNQYNDYKKMYLWVLNWVGFKSDVLEIAHHHRFLGKSTYNRRKLMSLAFNIMLSNSNKPLYLSVYFGLLYQYIINGGGLLGWSSTIVVIMFFNGLILTSIGITGIYIAKIFEQTKGRPRYIIAESLNVN
jgi:glycosyltransferase involved in cell wall biosynthesis